MEQLVLLLIIAAVSFINWILQKSAEHRRKQAQKPVAETEEEEFDFDHERTPVPNTAEKKGEKELREFLEALGLPVDEPPPPPIPSGRVQPSFQETISAPPPEPPAVSPKATAPKQSKREMEELAAKFRRSSQTAPSAYDLPVSADLHELVTNKMKVREGIILREILGPPKALDPEF